MQWRLYGKAIIHIQIIFSDYLPGTLVGLVAVFSHKFITGRGDGCSLMEILYALKVLKVNAAGAFPPAPAILSLAPYSIYWSYTLSLPGGYDVPWIAHAVQKQPLTKSPIFWIMP
jgi:hypothetical protein